MSQDGVHCCRVWVAMLFLLSSASVEGGVLRVWRPVLVSLQRIQAAYKTQQESFPLPQGAGPALYCGKICASQDWCKLWCAVPSTSPTSCLVSSIVVMPAYQETDTSDALICHTTRPKELATNTVITGGGVRTNTAQRTTANLVDGIYDHNNDACFATKDSERHQWFLLDFGEPKWFQHVILHAQNDINAPTRFFNVEVLVGNVTGSTHSDFDAYDQFGVFPGAAVVAQVVEMKSAKPVSARFVAVRKHDDTGIFFQACHVEVF